jgi:hypothetical protein
MKRLATLRRLMNGTAIAPVLGATAFWNPIISILRLNKIFSFLQTTWAMHA